MELVEDDDTFVVVLIGLFKNHSLWLIQLTWKLILAYIILIIFLDEVESLTAARAGAMAGTEPSDGLRVCIPSPFLEYIL
jgi:hypothetical protein